MSQDYVLDSQKETIEILEKYINLAKKGELLEVAVCGTLVSGDIYSDASKSENKFALAGALMALAMERLGFAEREKTEWERKRDEE